MLLDSGTVPAPLIHPGLGVDLEHRDGRLALGTLQDGRVVVALTRFDALGEVLGRVPLGLTSPEMAAVMGALGCRQALLLDGGISGQLLVRDSDGVRHTPSSTRRVPLGLVGRAPSLGSSYTRTCGPMATGLRHCRHGIACWPWVWDWRRTCPVTPNSWSHPRSGRPAAPFRRRHPGARLRGTCHVPRRPARAIDHLAGQHIHSTARPRRRRASRRKRRRIRRSR